MRQNVQLVNSRNARKRPKRQTKASAHDLLGKHLRAHCAKGTHDGNTLCVPTFTQLVDRDDNPNWGVVRVEVAQIGLSCVVVVLVVHLKHRKRVINETGATQALSNFGGMRHAGADHE